MPQEPEHIPNAVPKDRYGNALTAGKMVHWGKLDAVGRVIQVNPAIWENNKITVPQTLVIAIEIPFVATKEQPIAYFKDFMCVLDPAEELKVAETLARVESDALSKVKKIK
jgi:hypothetical protein